MKLGTSVELTRTLEMMNFQVRSADWPIGSGIMICTVFLTFSTNKSQIFSWILQILGRLVGLQTDWKFLTFQSHQLHSSDSVGHGIQICHGLTLVSAA